MSTYINTDVLKDKIQQCIAANAPKGLERKIGYQNELSDYISLILELRMRDLIRKSIEIAPECDESIPISEDRTFIPEDKYQLFKELQEGLRQCLYMGKITNEADRLMSTRMFYDLAVNCDALSLHCINDLKRVAKGDIINLQTTSAKLLISNFSRMLRIFPIVSATPVTVLDTRKAILSESGSGYNSQAISCLKFAELNQETTKRGPAPCFFPSNKVHGDILGWDT